MYLFQQRNSDSVRLEWEKLPKEYRDKVLFLKDTAKQVWEDRKQCRQKPEYGKGFSGYFINVRFSFFIAQIKLVDVGFIHMLVLFGVVGSFQTFITISPQLKIGFNLPVFQAKIQN